MAELKNPQLVAVAVGLLRGDAQPVHHEDVAIEVNSLAPGRFCWRKYPGRIDLVTVGVALRDAKKSQHGCLLVGGNSSGWMLSPRGIEWFANLDPLVLEQFESASARRDSLLARRQAERARLRRTRAYRFHCEGIPEAITRQDFYEFVRIDEYFRPRAVAKRYAIAENAVAGDADLSKLWENLKLAFRSEED